MSHIYQASWKHRQFRCQVAIHHRHDKTTRQGPPRHRQRSHRFFGSICSEWIRLYFIPNSLLAGTGWTGSTILPQAQQKWRSLPMRHCRNRYFVSILSISICGNEQSSWVVDQPRHCFSATELDLHELDVDLPVKRYQEARSRQEDLPSICIKMAAVCCLVCAHHVDDCAYHFWIRAVLSVCVQS